MKPEELLPLEKWMELENDIMEKKGFPASVFNTDGIRITDNMRCLNKLCPEVKATEKGQSFICAVAHMNLAILAKNSKKPVIEECDAGIGKLLVPIFGGEEFAGAVNVCGVLLDDGEVETFFINKTTDIEEEKIEALAKSIPAVSSAKMNELADYIQQFLDSELYGKSG